MNQEVVNLVHRCVYIMENVMAFGVLIGSGEGKLFQSLSYRRADKCKKYLEALFFNRRVHKSKTNFAAFQQTVPDSGMAYPKMSGSQILLQLSEIS